MRRLGPILLAILFSSGLGGCADGRSAGSTTQTENSLAARSLLVDSILPAWNRPDDAATVATLRLNASNFDFETTDPAGRDLAVTTDSGQPVPFRIVEWDRSREVGRIQVRIGSYLRSPGTRILLWRGMPLQNRSDPAGVWDVIPDSQKLAIGSVLVDNFDGTNLTSKLPSGNGWYSASTDTNTVVSSPSLASAGMGRPGKAIHISYAAKSSLGKYALIGIFLGAGNVPHDLGSLDSLEFWVRGSGNLAVAFDRLPPYAKAKAWTHRSLDSNWVRLRIRPQDFDSADGVGNNFGWDSVKHGVTNLSFIVQDGSDLWVDDVRMYGVDRDDLR